MKKQIEASPLRVERTKKVKNNYVCSCKQHRIDISVRKQEYKIIIIKYASISSMN